MKEFLNKTYTKENLKLIFRIFLKRLLTLNDLKNQFVDNITKGKFNLNWPLCEGKVLQMLAKILQNDHSI